MSRRQHISRLAVPATWPIAKKALKWVAKPSPGAHKIKDSLPLVVILRDLLKIGRTQREIKRVLGNKEILVNNKVRKDKNFCTGLLDIIAIPKTKQYYRVVLSKHKKLSLLPINEKEASMLPLRIMNKVKIKGNKTQINFTNGWNLIVEKDVYSTNDVLFFDFTKNKVVEHLKLDKGNVVYFLSGKHASKVATLQEIKESGVLRKDKIAVVSDGKEEWETLVNSLIVIGKGKPLIKVE